MIDENPGIHFIIQCKFLCEAQLSSSVFYILNSNSMLFVAKETENLNYLELNKLLATVYHAILLISTAGSNNKLYKIIGKSI